MRKKIKMIVMVEIAVVLCSMLVVALPAIAAEQNQEMQKVSASTITTASEDDYVLGVYGNANEDDTIDMRDLTYVKLIFFGKKPETELADAKYDDKINPLDFIQIKLIIVGKENEITLIDDFPKIVTVHKPVNHIVVLSTYSAEAIRSLKATDKVIGVSNTIITTCYKLLPTLTKLPDVGSSFNPDIERVLELEPDVVLAYAKKPSPEKFDDKLPENIKVVHLGFDRADLLIEDFKKFGYILNKRDEAEELIDFYEEFNSKINEQIEKLSEDEKPRVYFESMFYSDDEYKGIGKGEGIDAACTMAGGINIAEFDGYKTVDPEWVITQNPDFIIGQMSTRLGSGYEHDDLSKMKAIREGIMNRLELAEVTAVKEGKAYCIASQITYKPRYFVGVAYMAKWFHPELFEDLDPKALNEEYLERFLGVPYRGVYAYPEPS